MTPFREGRLNPVPGERGDELDQRQCRSPFHRDLQGVGDLPEGYERAAGTDYRDSVGSLRVGRVFRGRRGGGDADVRAQDFPGGLREAERILLAGARREVFRQRAVSWAAY